MGIQMDSDIKSVHFLDFVESGHHSVITANFVNDVAEAAYFLEYIGRVPSGLEALLKPVSFPGQTIHDALKIDVLRFR